MGHSLLSRWTEELRQKPAFIVLGLAIAVLLLYSPVHSFHFLRWDDSQYITDNVHVATGLTSANMKWALTETAAYYWHPLAHISHMADCQFFGLNAGSHHLVNVLIHAMNACALFLLLLNATRALWRSLLVACLFAFHPLNVETVAWVVERKSLLCTLFTLLTFAAYGWFVRDRSIKRYTVVVVAFLLALMSKPMAVTLPVLLLVLDYWPLRRSDSKQNLVLEKIPLLLMSAACSALTFLGQRAAGAIADVSAIPVGMRIEQAFLSYVTYILKLFWPTRLSPFYPYLPHWLPVWQVVAAVGLLTALTIAFVRGRKPRYGLAGWLFFIVAMLPVIGLVQVGGVVIADRFAYVPAIGLFVAVVWICGDWLERFKVPVAVPLTVSLAVLLMLGVATSHYLSYWENGFKLFSQAAAVSPAPHYMIEHLIGDSLVDEKRIDEALERYERSCELNPAFDLCHYNIAEIKFSRYDVRGALEEYQLAGSHTENRALAVNVLVNSADALIQLGDLNGAQSQLSNALALDPGNERARRMLAMLSR
jgi:protein O-mannosyl-transferase